MRWIAGLALVAGCPKDEPGPTDGGPTDGAEPTGETGTPTATGATGDTGETTGSFSIEATCDPTENALRYRCHVTVEPAQPVQIAFTEATGVGGTRVHTSDLVATEHDLVLYFLAPATDYRWTASAVAHPDEPVVTDTFTSGVPPASVLSRLVVTGSSSVPYIGTNTPCDAQAVAVIYETATGALVWYDQLSAQGSLGLLNMVQFTEDRTVLGQTGSAVVEVDLEGTELVRFEEGVHYEHNLHHDLFKRDGLYYLLFQEPSAVTLDGFLVFDALGTELARWRAADHLDIPPSAFGDWMHTNTLFVDDAGDVYMSLLTQNTVYKVEGDLASPDFGQPLWFMAGSQPAGLGTDYVVDWSVIGGEDWFGGQHHAHLRHDGRLTLLDNNNGRVLVVSVDEAGLTATVDEAWDTIQGVCGPQGTAADSSIGHTFAACSGDTIREWDPVSAVPTWEAEVDCAGGGGGFGSSAARWYPLEGW